MKFFKKVIMSVVLLAVVLVFCGCATASYRIDLNDDGSLSETYEIVLDTDTIKSAGYSDMQIANLKNHIASDLEANFNAFVVRYNSLDADGKAYVDDNFSFSKGWVDDIYTLRLEFDVLYMYYYFYNVSTDSITEPTTVVEEGTFIDKVTYSDTTIFSKITPLDYAYYSVYFPTYDLDDVQYSYTYATGSNRWHAVDADYDTFDGTNFAHTWNITSSNWGDTIELYYHSANEVAWLLLSTFVSLTVCAILLLIAIVKKIIGKDKEKSN